MKKVLNIAICLSIVLAAVLYAAKTPTDFGGGLKGFLKTKVGATSTLTNGWVVFTGMGAKDQLQITEANNVKGIMLDGGKIIKQKGKISGTIDSIVIATQVPDITDPANIITTLTGNEKLSIKLKGVNVGTVLAKTMKMVLVNDISGAIAGTAAKGVKIMTQDGGIEGDATEDVLVGAYDYAVGGAEVNIPVTTMIKAIKAKKGSIGYVDATEATPAKVGKTKWIAKIQSAGTVHVKSTADWSSKNKNVTLDTIVTE
ncbi:MAG: hypothetical protein DRI44_04170 [Chlamydiae bacterium]|nr:MAG: hypothetical protein DRI44_04170 [Chlamydiota bacterium]